ncbi:MAG: hypothetical protein IT176_05660 [Acidobacteria bacterium]|nr:hypothetical protein [Acidobacteriota bacterium]
MWPRLLVCGLLMAGSAAGAQAPPAANPPALDVVLARAADYVERYEKEFAGVVAEERYEQNARQGGRFDQFGRIRYDSDKRRVFRSDLLLVRPEGADSWLQFRDIFEVDGKLVRDRNNRLAKLFLEPNATTAKQIERIKNESARYNVGPVVRNINVPVMALRVVTRQNQFRFLYNHNETDDATRTDGAWAVDFREVGAGTMIRTNGEQDMPMEGRIWIEPDTGRVLGTIMRAQNQMLRGAIEVTYQAEPSLGLLVPRHMHEEYRMYTDGSGVIADATYSNFRRFQVKVDEQMAPVDPPQP